MNFSQGVPKTIKCQFLSRFEPCLVELPEFVDHLLAAGHCQATPSPKFFVGPFEKLAPRDFGSALVVACYAESPETVHLYASHSQADLDAVQAQLALDYDTDDSDELKLSRDEAKVNFINSLEIKHEVISCALFLSGWNSLCNKILRWQQLVSIRDHCGQRWRLHHPICRLWKHPKVQLWSIKASKICLRQVACFVDPCHVGRRSRSCESFPGKFYVLVSHLPSF